MNFKHGTLFVALMAALLIASASPLFGQGMRMTPQERTDRLKEQISLTDKQAEEVLKIYQEQQDEMDKVRKTVQGDREAMRAAMAKLIPQTDAKIEKLLTEEQLKKYEEFKKQRSQWMQGQRRG